MCGFIEREGLEMKVAVAVFVKTPGYSGVKTRLAKTIGQEKAESFYRQSIEQTASMLKGLKESAENIDVFWAVAEQEAFEDSMWKQYPIISQGEGDLGDRIHAVYNQLISKYDCVFLYGADSPHVTSDIFVEAIEMLEQEVAEFVVGPTEDGGFYVFASGENFEQSEWTSIPYSSANTLNELVSQLEDRGEVYFLPENFDVDEEQDLKRLAELDPQYSSYLP